MTVRTPDNWEMSAALENLFEWLVQMGLEDAQTEDWLETFCHRLVAAGIPLLRLNITVRAHHPEIGSIAFRWHKDGGNERQHFVRRSEATDEYITSPIYYLLANNVEEIRQDLTAKKPALYFPIFDELRERGATDYYAVKRFFLRSDHAASVDPMQIEECAIISLATDVAGGFTDRQIDGLRQLILPLCLTLKCSANRLMAEDITAAYLGRDASKRVLSGDLTRGSSETISAVICYFDLQGFTKLSESLPDLAIIDLLNDYFAEAVEVVEHHGGNVLKFMGDGMLAIFDIDRTPGARRIAIETAIEMRHKLKALNQRREAEGLPTTGFTLSLHAGDVLYGNIGGKTRLDFTVIGPAVNTTSRILDMCNALDQNIVISDKVATDLVGTIPELVSLGAYRLRGVAERLELFTVD